MGKQKLQGKENTYVIFPTQTIQNERKHQGDKQEQVPDEGRQRFQEESHSGHCCAGTVSLSHGA